MSPVLGMTLVFEGVGWGFRVFVVGDDGARDVALSTEPFSSLKAADDAGRAVLAQLRAADSPAPPPSEDDQGDG